jgi:uncharacterized damage-inducible protein DinB
MDRVIRIAAELARGHDGDPWHGASTRSVLAGVTAEEASARPIPSAHTIWELVRHMTAWKREVARRVRAGTWAPPEMGDWPEDATGDARAWQAALEDHDRAHRELLDALSSFPDGRLDEKVGRERDPAAGTGMTYEATLHGLAQHDAYHTGQVSLLKKALRPDRG